MSNDEFNQGKNRISEILSENENMYVSEPVQGMWGFFNDTCLV